MHKRGHHKVREYDISNHAFLAVLAVSFFLSFCGFEVLMNNSSITGLFTGTSGTGVVSFTQQGVLSITLTDAVSSFGNISSTSNGLCRVNTEGVANNCTAAYTNDKMQVENDGAVNAVVRINSTRDKGKGNEAEFALGTFGDFQVKGINAQTNACSSGLLSSYTSVPNATGTLLTLCSNLQFGASQHDLDVHYQLVIGTDLTPGNQTVNVTFWASLS